MRRFSKKERRENTEMIIGQWKSGTLLPLYIERKGSVNPNISRYVISAPDISGAGTVVVADQPLGLAMTVSEFFENAGFGNPQKEGCCGNREGLNEYFGKHGYDIRCEESIGSCFIILRKLR